MRRTYLSFILLCCCLFSFPKQTKVFASTFQIGKYPISKIGGSSSAPTSVPTPTLTVTPTLKPTPKPTSKPSSFPMKYPIQRIPVQSINSEGDHGLSPTSTITEPPKESTPGSSLVSGSTIGFILSTVVPAVGGSIGAVLAGVVGWGMLKKKNSTFTSYIKRIEALEKDYISANKNELSTIEHLKAHHREVLEKIQDEAETQAAVKKLTSEHLSVIVNRIQRYLKKLDSGSVKEQ